LTADIRAVLSGHLPERIGLSRLAGTVANQYNEPAMFGAELRLRVAARCGEPET